jgi:hypothetical protein
MKKIFLAALFVFSCFWACKKEQSIPELTFNTNEMYECHHLMQWDSTKLHSTLLGKWEWAHVVKSWGAGENSDDHIGLLLDFKADGTVDVYQNDVLQSTSTWDIDSSVRVNTSPIINETDGSILFCDNKVVFSGTPYDGFDNFFVKKE